MRVDAINKQNGLVSAPIGENLRSSILEKPSVAPDQLQTMSFDSPIKRGGGVY
jgi:hypothetical protein